MRNMAYVVTVKDVKPIEGKDRIEYVSFKENDYSVIAQKGLKTDDKVVYIEVDSILPVDEKFEFLRSRCFKDSLNGFLIKAMKMNGLYSFGIVFKPSDLGLDASELKSKQDLTDTLGVRKYEPIEDRSPVENKLPPLKKRIKSLLMRYSLTRPIGRKLFVKSLEKEDFPTWLIPKSDEDNLANNPEWFEKYKNTDNYITVKMEGKSVTCYFEDKKFLWFKKSIFKVFGRNVPLTEKKELEFFKSIGDKIKNSHVILQGEYCAPHVQRGIYKNGSHFYIYKIRDLLTNQYYTYEQMQNFASAHGLELVPLVDKKLSDFESIEDIYNFADKIYFKEGDISKIITNKSKFTKNHEGIVVRSNDINKDNWSFKVKSREYQLRG